MDRILNTDADVLGVPIQAEKSQGDSGPHRSRRVGQTHAKMPFDAPRRIEYNTGTVPNHFAPQQPERQIVEYLVRQLASPESDNRTNGDR